jgi:dCTP deaminase
LPDIVLDPFDEKYCGPNSYDLHLGDELLFYKPGLELPAKDENATIKVIIPPDGYILQPGDFCLASTVEYTETRNLVPMLQGRSSVGRMGVQIHMVAGFGDIGFCGRWTLQLKNLSNNPVRLIPNMKIAQLHYEPVGRDHILYAGKYSGSKGATASRLYKDIVDGTM